VTTPDKTRMANTDGKKSSTGTIRAARTPQTTWMQKAIATRFKSSMAKASGPDRHAAPKR